MGKLYIIFFSTLLICKKQRESEDNGINLVYSLSESTIRATGVDTAELCAKDNQHLEVQSLPLQL